MLFCILNEMRRVIATVGRLDKISKETYLMDCCFNFNKVSAKIISLM